MDNKEKDQFICPYTKLQSCLPIDDDEISLLAIWNVLWGKRLLVVGVTVLITVAAVIYALVSPVVCKAEAFLLPPSTSNVEQLNIPGIHTTTVGTVYAEAIKNLRSMSLRRRFFDEHNLLEDLRPKKTPPSSNSEDGVFANSFHRKLSVRKGTNENSDFITVTLEGQDPEKIAAWLNSFISQVNASIADELVKTLTTKINLKKETIQSNIKSLRNIAAVQRNDEIARLEEEDLIARNIIIDEIKTARIKATKIQEDRLVNLEENIIIAKNLGIDENSLLLSGSGSGKLLQPPNIEIRTSYQPLYIRGEKALRFEAEAINKRKSDDPFVQELRALERELALLETNKRADVLRKRKNDAPFIGKLRDLQHKIGELDQIEVPGDDVKAFLVDQPALIPQKRIKPKRRHIAVLGLMLGLMLGLLSAFLAYFVETNRNRS